MSDYGVLKNRILRELNRSDLTQEASAAVQTAIRYYETTRFWFNEQRAYTPTVADQEFYRLPSDLVSHDKLMVRQAGQEYPVEQVDYDTISDWVTSNPPQTGRPTFYAIYADQIRCYPTPNDNSMTLILSYIRALPSLVSDLDANEWTQSAEALIRAHAQRDIAGSILHDQNLAALYEVYARGEFQRLTRITVSKISSGRTKRWDYPVEGRYR